MSSAGTLLDATRRISRSGRRGRDLRETLEGWWNGLAGTPAKKKRLKRWAMFGGPVLVIGVAVALWLILRPVPQPDYKHGSLKKIFNYTLLTNEFNNLPVEKRMELIGQLVQRMKDMNAGDSLVLAAFASGIAGEARKHIEENISRLMIDMWDKYAQQYETVKPEDKAAFLDRTLIEFVRTLEAAGGEPSRQSDAELLADIRRQAERDRQNMSQGKGIPSPRALGRLFEFMHGNVGGHASNEQKPRGQLMVRDMMRHFRNQEGGPAR